MKKLKVLSLFAGVGGFDLGLERTGAFETVAFCEIDVAAQKVLCNHWPAVPIFSDVTELSYDREFRCLIYNRNSAVLETKIDVIVGGFPCQDVSVAGKKRGFKDENGETTRSGLWAEYCRLIGEIRPSYVIIENVRNLLSLGLTEVLQNLNDLGFDAEWGVISASSVGAHHKRERVWIVAWDPRRVPSDNNLSGFWPTFTTEKEKSHWWAKTTARFRTWWANKPELCRVVNELPERLDESNGRPEGEVSSGQDKAIRKCDRPRDCGNNRGEDSREDWSFLD